MFTPMIKRLQVTIIVISWLSLAGVVPVSAQVDGDQIEITEMRLSNYGGNNFVVSWRTSEPTSVNELLLGLAPDQLTTVLSDELESPGKLHMVPVLGSDLNPIDAMYYFKVRSDGVEASAAAAGYDSIYVELEAVPVPAAIIQGYLVDSRTGEPEQNALVRTFCRLIRTTDNVTQVDSTMWYTVKTDADGKYVMSMGNYRQYGGQRARYVPGGTWLHLEIMGQDQTVVPDSILLPFITNSSGEYVILDTLGVLVPVDPGDLDGNSSLDVMDLLEMLKVIGGKISPEPWQQDAADLDGNGRVDIFDLLTLLVKIRNNNTLSS